MGEGAVGALARACIPKQRTRLRPLLGADCAERASDERGEGGNGTLGRGLPGRSSGRRCAGSLHEGRRHCEAAALRAFSQSLGRMRFVEPRLPPPLPHLLQLDGPGQPPLRPCISQMEGHCGLRCSQVRSGRDGGQAARVSCAAGGDAHGALIDPAPTLGHPWLFT